MAILLTNFIGFDGQQLSRDNPITVKWKAAAPPQETSPAMEETVFVGYMNGVATRPGGLGGTIGPF